MNKLPTLVCQSLDPVSRPEVRASLHRPWPMLPAAARHHLAHQVARLLRPMLLELRDTSMAETTHAEPASDR